MDSNPINKFRHIIVTKEVYEQLINQGKISDTFNDVVKRLLGIETTATVNENMKETKERQ